MITHHLKLTLRQLAKNKIHSFLGIASFAFGFAVCLVIALFVHNELTVDKCFSNYKRVYRLIDGQTNGVRMVYNDKEVILENYPEIEQICPVEYHAQWARPVYTGTKSVYVHGSITTDSTFFDVFSIPVVKSISDNPFANINSAVLTESGAHLLFEDEEPLGKQLTLDNDQLLMVSAVIPDFPENTSMKADILLSTENRPIRASHTGDGKGGWNYSVNLYAMLHETASPTQLIQKMNDTLEELGTNIHRVDLQRLDQIYLGQSIRGNDNNLGNMALIFMFGAVGLLILILSLINHINFILSLQLKKMKEIGIKKTSGAGFGQLMTSYFVEISVWILFSFTLALLFVEGVLPYICQLFDRSLHFITIFSMPFFIYVILSLLLVLSVSSIAHIFMLKRFDVKSYMSGRLGGFRKNQAKKVMTVFQFAISIILLIGVFVIQNQIQYVKHQDLGFNQEHLLMLKFPYQYKQGQVIQNRLAEHASIMSTSLSRGNPGNILYNTSDKNGEGSDFLLNRIDIDHHFLETLDIQLLQGRTFLQGEYGKACLINETALNKYGWENLEGKKFHEFAVVGVVKDFHVSSLHSPIEALSLVLDNSQPSTLNIRIRPENIGETMEFIRNTWYAASPQTPFEYQFYDDWYDAVYRAEERFASTVKLFTVIAFLITCLGLLGQTFQVCINRTKEIGIRKVLGASVSGIVVMLTKDFTKFALLANLIAWPIAWYATNKWLQNFAYHVGLNLWVFVLAGLLALVIALLTVSYQAIRAATANPVESLKYE